MDITSGDESAQRATSDVYLFPRVMYICNIEPLRGGVLVIHTFTMSFQCHENGQFLAKTSFLGKLQHFQIIFFQVEMSSIRYQGSIYYFWQIFCFLLCIGLLGVMYCFAKCDVL